MSTTGSQTCLELHTFKSVAILELGLGEEARLVRQTILIIVTLIVTAEVPTLSKAPAWLALAHPHLIQEPVGLPCACFIAPHLIVGIVIFEDLIQDQDVPLMFLRPRPAFAQVLLAFPTVAPRIGGERAHRRLILDIRALLIGVQRQASIPRRRYRVPPLVALSTYWLILVHLLNIANFFTGCRSFLSSIWLICWRL